MATYNGKEGVWRTVGGRRIFIANGEDLATAMRNSGKFNRSGTLREGKNGMYLEEDNKSMDSIISDTKPKDTRYMEFGYEIEDDKITLRAEGTKKVEHISEDSDYDIDNVAITKMERWAKKVGTEIKKNKSIKNGKEIAEAINDELDWDWYSGMSFFGGDVPFTYGGFQFTIDLDVE
jgi:hypothetical protein